MACHRELIDEVQRAALGPLHTRLLELATSDADYGADRTHFNRAYLFRLGPALFHTVDTSRQLVHNGCLACHGSIARLVSKPEELPLRKWRPELAASVWAPERVGVACGIAAPRRITMRKIRGKG